MLSWTRTRRLSWLWFHASCSFTLIVPPLLPGWIWPAEAKSRSPRIVHRYIWRHVPTRKCTKILSKMCFLGTGTHLHGRKTVAWSSLLRFGLMHVSTSQTLEQSFFWSRHVSNSLRNCLPEALVNKTEAQITRQYRIFGNDREKPAAIHLRIYDDYW